MIVLVGENLSNVTKITFNNMEVDLSEVYATSKRRVSLYRGYA